MTKDATPAELRKTSVAIVGGGLAGLAAAVALCERGLRVELFESRRQLGGRAGSFRDPASGELVDHCQHVGMGCCTNLDDFCRRTNIADLFRRHTVLHFFGPDGRRYDLRASRWLPAPLHLAPSLLRLGYLSLRERIGVARTLLRLARMPSNDAPDSPTIGHWLREQHQSQRAIDRFWSVVLVSALGESVDRASLAAARKVFVDGFMAHRDAYHVTVPTVPLGELYGEHVAGWLRERGVAMHLGSAVAGLDVGGDTTQVTGVRLADGSHREFEYFIIAVPWRGVCELLPESLQAAIPELRTIEQIESSPITGVHLWFDRPITALPHAVLIDRLSQWVFNRGQDSVLTQRGRESFSAYDPAVNTATGVPPKKTPDPFYYQVVISASRELAGRDRNGVLQEILGDLQTIWPAARDAKLLHWRLVTEHDAVFSVRPGFDRLRPPQRTAVPNLMLAGDWTRTGWPATMESAVRSGYLAAEAVLAATGNHVKVLAADLPRGWLARRCLAAIV